MATPVIAAVSEQDITIDTDYSLRVGITNDPEEVTVDGLLEGFAYTWHEDDDEVEIFGAAERLLADAMWTVFAKETPTSTAITRDIIYNVLPSAPIIDEVGEQNVHIGFDNDIFVEIQNKPTRILVDGLLTGLKFEPDSDGEGDDQKEGVRLTGMLPGDVNLTVDNTDFSIEVENDGGSDLYDLPINLTTVAPPMPAIFTAFRQFSPSENRIGEYDITTANAETVTEVRHLVLPSPIQQVSSNSARLAVDGNDFYYQIGTTVYRLQRSTVDGATATVLETINFPDDILGVDVDENYIYTLSIEGSMGVLAAQYGAVKVWEKSEQSGTHDATLVRTFDLLGNSTAHTIAVDDDYVYYGFNNDDGDLGISWCDKDTADGTTASRVDFIFSEQTPINAQYGISTYNDYLVVIRPSGSDTYRIEFWHKTDKTLDRYFIIDTGSGANTATGLAASM